MIDHGPRHTQADGGGSDESMSYICRTFWDRRL